MQGIWFHLSVQTLILAVDASLLENQNYLDHVEMRYLVLLFETGNE